MFTYLVIYRVLFLLENFKHSLILTDLIITHISLRSSQLKFLKKTTDGHFPETTRITKMEHFA